jgi:hypothetical protein
MISRRVCFLGLFLLCITTLLSARGNKEKEEPLVTVVQVTGIVRLTGTALFPELVITGSQAEWYVAKEEMDKLNDLQRRTVTVEGEETIIELKFASGLPAGTRRELRNIRIIAVE